MSTEESINPLLKESLHESSSSRIRIRIVTNDDFFLILEYLAANSESEPFKRICDKWPAIFLSADDQAELAAIVDEVERKERQSEKMKTAIRPLWLFFVALCHALQEGENELTATDAFWLGLIDEVIGLTAISDCSHLRDAPATHSPWCCYGWTS